MFEATLRLEGQLASSTSPKPFTKPKHDAYNDSVIENLKAEKTKERVDMPIKSTGLALFSSCCNKTGQFEACKLYDVFKTLQSPAYPNEGIISP